MKNICRSKPRTRFYAPEKGSGKDRLFYAREERVLPRKLTVFFSADARRAEKDSIAFCRENHNNSGMIKSIYIWPNLTKDKYLAPVREVVNTLEERGFVCLLSAENEQRLYGTAGRHGTSAADADLVLSVGGDGTFLRAGETAFRYDKPLCGCNAGRLGFLCALKGGELASFDPARLVFTREPVLRCQPDGKEHFALSDIVIGKDYFGGTVVPAWRIGEGATERCIGDGLILSTPLGSTGYTRSAGGPSLARGCGKFALTPICPHSGCTEARVFPDTETVTVSNADVNYSASVYADGRRIGPLLSLAVTKAPRMLTVAKRPDTDTEPGPRRC